MRGGVSGRKRDFFDCFRRFENKADVFDVKKRKASSAARYQALIDSVLTTPNVSVNPARRLKLWVNHGTRLTRCRRNDLDRSLFNPS